MTVECDWLSPGSPISTSVVLHHTPDPGRGFRLSGIKLLCVCYRKPNCIEPSILYSSIWVYLQTRRNLRSVDMRDYQTYRSQRISDPCGKILFWEERTQALYQFQSLFICMFELYLTMFSKAFFCTTRSSEYFGILIGCVYPLVKGCEEKNNFYSE